MKSRTMDVAGMLVRIRHKAEVLDAADSFPSDRAASKALGVARSTIGKWRRQTDLKNRRSLLTSFAGIPGPKSSLTDRGECFDKHEGAILTLFRCFPEWSDGQVKAGLNTLGLALPLEHIQMVRLMDRIRSSGQDVCDVEEEVGVGEVTEQEFSESNLLNVIQNRILTRFLEEKPLRAGFIVTNIVLQQTRVGQELANLAQEYDLKSEGIDANAIKNECKALRQEALKLRKILLDACSPGKESGGLGTAEE